MNNALVAGRTQEGTRVYYTGKAGEGFISTEIKDAFKGYNLEGARNRAKMLNQGTLLHGIHFIGITEEQEIGA